MFNFIRRCNLWWRFCHFDEVKLSWKSAHFDVHEPVSWIRSLQSVITDSIEQQKAGRRVSAVRIAGFLRDSSACRRGDISLYILPRSSSSVSCVWRVITSRACVLQSKLEVER